MDGVEIPIAVTGAGQAKADLDSIVGALGRVGNAQTEAFTAGATHAGSLKTALVDVKDRGLDAHTREQGD